MDVVILLLRFLRQLINVGLGALWVRFGVGTKTRNTDSCYSVKRFKILFGMAGQICPEVYNHI